MIPVSPMPPAVAQNSSGSSLGVTSWTPAGVARVSDVTWDAKLPSAWWFLPCTSAAMAPPTDTHRVPGDTGTNQPRGTSARRMASRLVPPPTARRPAASSLQVMWSRAAVATTVPPAFWAASP
jgi:hypothetical protein